MSLNRREFLSTAGTAGLAMLAAPKLGLAGTDPDGFLRLVAEPVSQRLYGDTDEPSALWGYNGSVPGPDIRVRQGTLPL